MFIQLVFFQHFQLRLQSFFFVWTAVYLIFSLLAILRSYLLNFKHSETNKVRSPVNHIVRVGPGAQQNIIWLVRAGRLLKILKIQKLKVILMAVGNIWNWCRWRGKKQKMQHPAGHHPQWPGLGIRSFAHFAQIKWATVSNLLRSLKTNEWSAQVAQMKWATVSESLRSLKTNERPWGIAQVAQRKWVNEQFAQNILAKKI